MRSIHNDQRIRSRNRVCAVQLSFAQRCNKAQQGKEDKQVRDTEWEEKKTRSTVKQVDVRLRGCRFFCFDLRGLVGVNRSSRIRGGMAHSRIG